MTSLSLPYAGAWLTCAPIPALGLHMRGPEFVVAVKFRLGLNIYDKAGKCPSCGKESDELGDHGMVCATLCGTGGESISRHNALRRKLRDAIFDTGASAGLAPLKEERALLPGGLPIFSSVIGVEGRMLPWTLPSPTLSRVTPEQEQH